MNTYLERELHDPATGARGYLVIDRLVGGVAAGSLSLSVSVTMEDVRNEAEVSTYKHSLMGLPVGGAHAGLVCDPSASDKQAKLEAFARLVESHLQACVLVGEGLKLGAPSVKLPGDFEQLLDAGRLAAIEAAAEVAGLSLGDATVAVQGFDEVGKSVAALLASKGARIVEVQDGEEFFGLGADLLVLGSGRNALDLRQAEKVQAKLIVEAVTGVTTYEADMLLAERSVHVQPDFMVNAGQATAIALQLAGHSVTAVERIGETVRTVLRQAGEQGETDRVAALALAAANMQKTMLLV